MTAEEKLAKDASEFKTYCKGPITFEGWLAESRQNVVDGYFSDLPDEGAMRVIFDSAVPEERSEPVKTKPKRKRKRPAPVLSELSEDEALVMPTPTRVEDWVPDPDFPDYATNITGEVMRIRGGRGAMVGQVLHPQVAWVYKPGQRPRLTVRFKVRDKDGKRGWATQNHFLNNRMKTLSDNAL